MILLITNLSTSFADQNTRVTVQIFETIGSVERLENTFVVTVPGKHSIITEELREIIYQELSNSGFAYNQPTE